MTWKPFADDAATTWDTQLLQFSDHNVYQSWGWGRYKEQRGWYPRHFHVEADGGVAAMLQALVRTYPLRTVLAWCPGGPVGAIEACTTEMMRQLARHLGARAFYCRASLPRVGAAADVRFLQAHGWTRPRCSVSANTTAVWDLRKTEEQLLAGLNRNWRYSLRQAQKAGLAAEHLVEAPIQELARLSAEMHAAKSVSMNLRPADLAGLFDALGRNVIAYGCRNASGRLIAFHSCGWLGQRAWELVAATSEEGRQNGASFAVLWALVLHCRRMNVTHYDLAGVDYEKAPGVSNFKRWTGAEHIERLGEWEWSTSPLLTRAVDMVVRNRSAGALP